MIYTGDCLEKLKELPESSVDAIVTDPPYGLTSMTRPRTDKIAVEGNDGSGNPYCRKQAVGGFMGKEWDGTGIENNVDMWKECLRVLKPGGYLLSFGGTRTYHRMASAIEDAGFEIRDMIEWVYGSGFPKSLNIGKAVDKLQGNEREVVGESWNMPDLRDVGRMSKETIGIDKLSFGQVSDAKRKVTTVDKGTSEWEGWGTALKPAHEPICMARKPLAEKTVAENVLKYGTGGINIDGCRVGIDGQDDRHAGQRTKTFAKDGDAISGGEGSPDYIPNTQGRFPANLIHDGSEEVRECFPQTKSGWTNKDTQKSNSMFLGEMNNTGNHYSDNSGSASRFFYCAKASKSERNMGLENFEKKKVNDGRNTPIDNAFQRGETKRTNTHPTVKPIALMEYLINMVTREGQIVLDPFAGSGSTLIAAKKLGRKYIGIELEPEYVKIAEARLNSVQEGLL